MNAIQLQNRILGRPRGSTLIVVLAGSVLAAAVLVALVESSATNTQSTNMFVDSQGTYYAASGAAELARSEIWGRYLTTASHQSHHRFRCLPEGPLHLDSVVAGCDHLRHHHDLFIAGQRLEQSQTGRPHHFEALPLLPRTRDLLPRHHQREAACLRHRRAGRIPEEISVSTTAAAQDASFGTGGYFGRLSEPEPGVCQ